MAHSFDKYDDVLSSILVNEKSILGFLSAIFNFLARRTDFYLVPEGPYENIGFPPGVAEELVLKVLRKCDPKNYNNMPNGARKPDLNSDLNNEIMCSTVAQEVEVVADEVEEANADSISNTDTEQSTDLVDNTLALPQEPPNQPQSKKVVENQPKTIPDNYTPPVIPTQKNSETYNGADREKYCWSQTIMELDVIVKLPPEIKTSKDLKVTINAADICVASRSGEIIIKDTLPYKIKTIDSFWSVSERKLLIHLEKVQERWWNKLLNNEEPIDLSKIDCSRPLNELPQDHIDKVRELQWNQEQKLKGLPTSDEIRNMEILKKAWNAPGSPFSGKEFDPNVLNQSSINNFPN
ncbi:nudC domain-containing protein 3 [Galleria mellonella]|uniref:NudC domain-containing protein 3 n=1 Tax=Galleria mellonella TaxID=7137 RepID=A0A6J1WIV3_GALME|nr:nudC domain-containing protein 3 [Galleria mellonella]